MNQSQSTAYRPKFNSSIKIEAREERLSGDAGALVLRDIFSGLGMDEFFIENLIDPRDQAHITHPLIELLRTHLLLLAQGWQDQDDADSLRNDPIFRLAVSNRGGDDPLKEPSGLEPDGLASQPTLSRLVTILSSQREVLSDGLFTFAARRIQTQNNAHRLRHATLDVDSFPLEVFGKQEGSTYNGYYGYTCYHPLVASIGETGDLLDLRLREGNAHTAEGSLGFILDLLDRMEKEVCQVASVRFDAGFPEDNLLSALENRDVGYVARIKNNKRLNDEAKPYLEKETKPADDEPTLRFHDLMYQAKKWSCPRRVVLVIKHQLDEMYPEHFFLLTNWSAEQMTAEQLLYLYRERGTAEGYFGEFKSVLEPALSSTQREKSHYRGESPQKRYVSQEPFAANEVKLLLNALAYSIMHAARSLMEKATSDGWRLSRLRERVLRVPARLILHARYVTVVINRQSADLWEKLTKALERFCWIPYPRAA